MYTLVIVAVLACVAIIFAFPAGLLPVAIMIVLIASVIIGHLVVRHRNLNSCMSKAQIDLADEFRELVERFHSSLGLDHVLDEFCDYLSAIIPELGPCTPFLVEPSGKWITFEASNSKQSFLHMIPGTVSGDEVSDIAQRLLSHGPIMAPVQDLPESITGIMGDSGGYRLLVPLIYLHKLLGVVVVSIQTFDCASGREALHKVITGASIAAYAISKIWLEAYTDTTFQALRNLRRVIVGLGPNATVTDVINSVVEQTPHVTRTDMVAVFTIDPRIGAIECKHSLTIPFSVTEEVEQIVGSIITDLDQTAARIFPVSYYGQPVGDYPTYPALQEVGICSIVAAPIRSGAGATGAVVAFYPFELRYPGLLAHGIESIADIVALALPSAIGSEQSYWFSDDFAESNKELQTQANEDYLTGLANHRYLQQTLADMCNATRRKNARAFSFIMADVDYFKRYNDAHGHQEGDEVLRKVGAILNTAIRSVDFAARYGGEEFAIILHMDKEAAIVVADRIRQIIEDTSCGITPVTISIGIAEYPKDGLTPSEVIDKADQALYRAKALGRNRVEVWHDNQADTSDIAKIKEDLDIAC